MKLILPILAFILLLDALSGHTQAIPVRNFSGAQLTAPADIVNKYAKLLNVPADSIKNIQLYTLIEQYSFTPYKFGGNDSNGVDCSGFSCVIEKQVFGLTIPRSTGSQAKVVASKSISELKEGDLVFLKLGGTAINHVGVYLQNGYFVHATSNLGIILDNVNDPDTQQRFMACGSVSK
ncbi:MAG: C40 family peptidase [Mucilaginibacter sp.]